MKISRTSSNGIEVVAIRLPLELDDEDNDDEAIDGIGDNNELVDTKGVEDTGVNNELVDNKGIEDTGAGDELVDGNDTGAGDEVWLRARETVVVVVVARLDWLPVVTPAVSEPPLRRERRLAILNTVRENKTKQIK